MLNVILLCITLTPVVIFAQADPPRAPNGLRPDTTSPNVYLNENLEATEQLTRLQRLSDAGEWSDAVALARDLIERHGRELVRVQDSLFESVTRQVNRRIASWPSPGLNAYRRLLDDDAKQLLDEFKRSPDLIPALSALDSFMFTSHVRELARLVAERAIEQGRFEMAISSYRELIRNSPEADVIRNDAAAYLAIAYAYLGHLEASTYWKHMAEATGEQELAKKFDWTHAGPAATDRQGDWPVFGGNATRSGLTQLDLDQAASLWELKLAPPTATDDENSSEGFFQDLPLPNTLPPSVQALPSVIADDRLFVQNASQLWAVDVTTGNLLWTFAHAPEVNALLLQSGNAPLWHSPVVHQQQVLAAFSGGPCGDDGGNDDEPAASSRDCRPVLTCLNAADGSVVWRVRQQDLGGHWDEKFFDASPLVVGDTVVVVIRRQRVFGFEDCYLYGFDLKTGSERYQVHLGGSSAGGFGYRRPTLSIPAADGDSVFVTTNIGTIASISADTGLVRWLRIYPQAIRSGPVAGGRGLVLDLKPWHYSPMLCQQAAPVPDANASKWPSDPWPKTTLICTPLDSGALWFLDAHTGDIENQVPRSELPPETTLVGVRDGVLYAAAMRPFAYDMAARKFKWTVELPGEDEIEGHALLTREGLYVPTKKNLLRLALDNGAIAASRWDSLEEAGGSLTAHGDQLFTTNPLRVVAYTSRDKVFAALKTRLRERPNDPSAALDMAEIAIRNHERQMAIDAIDESIRRMGGLTQLMDPELESRLFEQCITFAISLERAARTPVKLEDEVEQNDDDDDSPEPVELAESRFSYPPEDAALIHRLYGYASQCAPDIDSELVYRFRWAEFHKRNNSPTDAVALYQQVIADRSLREASLPLARLDDLVNDESRMRLARLSSGVIAEKVIGRLINQWGRDIYAAFDAAAAEKLIEARRRNEVAAFDSVVQSFPNSSAAPSAWLAKADLLRSQSQTQAAISAYATALSRYPKAVPQPEVTRPEIMRRIADTCLEADRTRDAWRWLTKAAREHPSSMIDLEGKRLTIPEYLAMRIPEGVDALPSLPQLTLPLVPSFTHEFPAEAKLLNPHEPELCEGSWRHALVYFDKTLNNLDPRTGEQLWPAPIAFGEKPELLLTTESKFILATGHRISAHHRDTGDMIWNFREIPDDLDDPHNEHESSVRLTARGTDGVRLLALDSDGIASCLELATGKVLWQAPLPHQPTDKFLVTDSWFLYQGVQSNRSVYVMADVLTGQLIRVIDPSDDRQVLQMALTLDGQLLLVTTQKIYGYDPNTGEQRWQRQVNGNLLENTIVVDLDGLYFSIDGREIEKLLFTDGQTAWKATPEGARMNTRTTARLQGGQLLLFNGHGVYALDAVDGRVRWEGVLPPGVDLESAHLYSDRYWGTVDDEHDDGVHDCSIYFYDYAGGKIPNEGGVLRLDDLSGSQFSIRDESILLMTDRKLQAWSSAR